MAISGNFHSRLFSSTASTFDYVTGGFPSIGSVMIVEKGLEYEVPPEWTEKRSSRSNNSRSDGTVRDVMERRPK